MNKEELLKKYGEPIKVLDHGFVQLLDLMGDDEAIEEMARTSYQKGTRKVSDTRGLIRYLVRHAHTSPLEGVELKVRVKLPIFVERQFARTRTASWNEISGRYSELPEEFYVPEAEQICYQSTDNKQGRSGPLPQDDAAWFQDLARGSAIEDFGAYHAALAKGVARETARITLPLSTYTMKVWKIDGSNLLKTLKLRLSTHAQWEIRVFAEAIANIVKDWLPITYEAFEDYSLNAHTFSAQELTILSYIVSDWLDGLDPQGHLADGVKEILEKKGIELTKREIAEFVRVLS